MNEGDEQERPEAGSAGSDGALSRLDDLRDERVSTAATAQPDRRDGSVYHCPPDLLLALKTALVTGRPLLLHGPPGSGKSTIAPYVARNLGWRYYEFIVDAQTEPQDLLWRFDLVRRLADAQMGRGEAMDDADYVEPGVLWWMLDRQSARQRGTGRPTRRPATEPNGRENQDRADGGAVLLIDEIDKAEPDVPGGLLVPLGSFRFTVTDTGASVPAGAGQGPVRRLVVITTNDDRELPRPFLRRCVIHRIEPPAAIELVEIAKRHLAAEGHDVVAMSRDELDLLQRLADRVTADDGDASTPGPSIAEYLDAVRAARELGGRLSDDDLQFVERLLLSKWEAVGW